MTTGSSPTTQASCPWGSAVTSPGRASNSTPSDITMCSVPCTWYWKCGASQSSVPASGLTSWDQRQPGRRVSLPTSPPPIRSRCRAPWSNGRVLAGGSKLFCSAFPVMELTSPKSRMACEFARRARGLLPPRLAGPGCTELATTDRAAAELAGGAGPGFDTGMRSLAVRVLNDFGVDGMEPQSLGSRKARLALHLLALAGGQVVTSAALEDALWGDTPPAKPDEQLAVLVSRLRSVLGRDRIEHRDHGYLLHFDWLDAAELTGLTEEMDRRRRTGHVVGAAAAARVALSLIRGDGPKPLPGEWAQLKRADLERLIRRARQVAATALLDAGDWMAAADTAATALEHDPYDEAALRVLLRAQVMGGRVAAALAAYASTRGRRADELGTDPSPETQSLQLSILRGELAPPGPVPAPASVGLVGRDDELG